MNPNELGDASLLIVRRVDRIISEINVSISLKAPCVLGTRLRTAHWVATGLGTRPIQAMMMLSWQPGSLVELVAEFGRRR